MNATTTTPEAAREASSFKTVDRPLSQWHIWSRVWPRYDRRYEGIVWAADAAEAGATARRQFGTGKVFDVQSGKWGGIAKKGA